MTQQFVATYRLEIKIKNERMAPRYQRGFDGVDMKILLALLTSLFSFAIVMIGGFQLMRLVAIKLAKIVAEAWHGPEMQSLH